MSNNVEISSDGSNWISLGDISTLPLQVVSVGRGILVRYVQGSVNAEVRRVRQTFSEGGTPVTFSFSASFGFTLSVTGSPNNTGSATVNPPNISFTAPNPGTGDTWDAEVQRGSATIRINFEDDHTSN